jgi:hypothetical protein
VNSEKPTFSIAGSAKITLPGPGEGNGTGHLGIIQNHGFNLSLAMNGDYLLCIDHNENAQKEFIRNGGSIQHSVLLRLEPESVFPSQYTQKVEEKYALIFSPGRIDQTNDFWVGWPYKFAADPNLPKANESNFQDYLDDQLHAGNFDLCNWEKRKILISMVAAN